MTDRVKLAKLSWRCRRGMRELDFLLQRYLTEYYSRATRDEQAAFNRLLCLQDPVILSYVMRREKPEDLNLISVINQISSAARHRTMS